MADDCVGSRIGFVTSTGKEELRVIGICVDHADTKLIVAVPSELKLSTEASVEVEIASTGAAAASSKLSVQFVTLERASVLPRPPHKLQTRRVQHVDMYI